MRFDRYLNEDWLGSKYEVEGRKKPISNEEAKEYIHKHCKKALLSTPIWRGTVSSDKSEAFFVEPWKFRRESRNTSNHYTLLIDNSPEWREYPKRGKSLICTLALSYARHYGAGKAYRIFPVDGSKIGVCPHDDFWGSFDDFRPMDMFNDNLVRLVEYTRRDIKYLIYQDPKAPDTAKELSLTDFENFKNASSYTDVVNGLDYVDSQKAFIKESAMKWCPTEFLKLQKYWNDPKLDLLVDLDNRLSPFYNAFDLVYAGDSIGQKGSSEVWTDGTCIMVDADTFKYDPNWWLMK